MSTPAVYHIAALLDHLVAAVETARIAAAGNARWANAVEAAYDHLLQVETIELDDHGALTYHSASGETYKANGTCQCRAHLSGQPCKHRAASKLVKNALALQQRQAEQQRTSTLQRIARAQAAAMVLFA